MDIVQLPKIRLDSRFHLLRAPYGRAGLDNFWGLAIEGKICCHDRCKMFDIVKTREALELEVARTGTECCGSLPVGELVSFLDEQDAS
jgi:hypothetical protein